MFVDRDDIIDELISGLKGRAPFKVKSNFMMRMGRKMCGHRVFAISR